MEAIILLIKKILQTNKYLSGKKINLIQVCKIINQTYLKKITFERQEEAICMETTTIKINWKDKIQEY